MEMFFAKIPKDNPASGVRGAGMVIQEPISRSRKRKNAAVPFARKYSRVVTAAAPVASLSLSVVIVIICLLVYANYSALRELFLHSKWC